MKIEPPTMEIRANRKAFIAALLVITTGLTIYSTYTAAAHFKQAPVTIPFGNLFVLALCGYSVLHLARLFWLSPIVIRMSQEGLLVPTIYPAPIPWAAIANLHHRKGGEGEKGSSILVIVLKKGADDQFPLENLTSKWNPFARWAKPTKFEVGLDYCAMPYVQIMHYLNEWLQLRSGLNSR